MFFLHFHSPSLPGIFLALAAIAYEILALRAVARFTLRNGGGSFRPPVSVLVPAHGLQPKLYECLRSICDQDYPVYQVLFGLHSADDPARSVIERIIAEFPGCDIELVIDGYMIGANPKNCNLANMYPSAKHDVIVMVDSDIKVERDFLATIVEPLEDSAVGGVTCIYKAAAEDGLPSQLGALAINDWFIPSALVDLGMREIDICYGAAIAVTRDSLDSIGGFGAMASAVAQDYVFGKELNRHGYRIALAPCVVETIVSEPHFGSLFRHELRWNRAVRACRPFDHGLSVVTHSLPLSVLFLMLPHPTLLGGALIATIMALRIALHYLVRARIPIAGHPQPWLVPVRECLSCGVWLASFFAKTVRWGKHRLVIDGDYSMSVAEDGGP